MFRAVHLSIIRGFSLHTHQWYMSVKPVWHIPLLCVQWNTPDDGQRNCPKYVELYSKNKFEKLVHPVGFIIRRWSFRCSEGLIATSAKPADDFLFFNEYDRWADRCLLATQVTFPQPLPFLLANKWFNVNLIPVPLGALSSVLSSSQQI